MYEVGQLYEELVVLPVSDVRLEVLVRLEVPGESEASVLLVIPTVGEMSLRYILE